MYHEEFQVGGENPITTLNIPFTVYLSKQTELSIELTSKNNTMFDLLLLGNPHPVTNTAYAPHMLSKTEILFIG